MIQDVVLETAQAIHAMQLSMSYSNVVQKLSLDTQETVAQIVTQVMPPPVSAGHYIDTCA